MVVVEFAVGLTFNNNISLLVGIVLARGTSYLSTVPPHHCPTRSTSLLVRTSVKQPVLISIFLVPSAKLLLSRSCSCHGCHCLGDACRRSTSGSCAVTSQLEYVYLLDI